MSLVTTCPACGTAFRVTPEQLSAHRGDVRCGQCQHIFNALQKLEEVTPLTSTPLMQPVEETIEQVATEFEQTVILPPTEPAVSEPIPPEPDIEQEPVEELQPVVGTVDFELEFPVVEEVDIVPMHVAEAGASETQEEIEEIVVEPTTGPELELPVPQAVAAAPGPAAVTPGFLQPEAKRSVSRWLLVPLALLLLAAILGQTAYFLRTEIAAHYPPMRPWLEQACVRLACTVELPRQADLLSIEDSDLQDDADHAGVLLLVSALYNRAPYPQAYPLLELTLTDTYDKPVLRRTFAPREYLPAGTDIKAGIAAGGEVHSRLPLVVEGEKPAGYRLYVRY